MSGFFNNLRRTNWLLTGKLAMARGFAVGIIMTIISLATGTAQDTLLVALTAPLWMAILSPAIGLGFQVVGQALSLGGDNPFFSLPALACFVCGWVFTALGDPIVYIVNRMVPDLLNVADFNLFNLNAFMLVLNPE